MNPSAKADRLKFVGECADEIDQPDRMIRTLPHSQAIEARRRLRVSDDVSDLGEAVAGKSSAIARAALGATLGAACLLAVACADGKPRQSGQDRNASVQERTKEGLSLSDPDQSGEPAGRAPAIADGMERLSGDEIRALVTGRTLSTHFPSMRRRLSRRERYQEGGILEVHLDRGVVLTGSYAIEDDRLCTRVPERPESCRTIYKHSDGHYLIDDPRGGRNILYPLVIE
jgi:hypothetical protein